MSFGGLERALRGVERFLRAVVLRLRTRFARQQKFLPFQIRGLIAQLCLRRANVGFPCLDRGLLLARVELCEDLADKHMVAHLDQSFRNLTAESESEIRFNLRPYLPG